MSEHSLERMRQKFARGEEKRKQYEADQRENKVKEANQAVAMERKRQASKEQAQFDARIAEQAAERRQARIDRHNTPLWLREPK